MSKLFQFLKPAPYIQEIDNPEEVARDYKYWRVRIFYSMFIGYALYYFTRKSFTFAMPGMIDALGFTKSELGLLGSIFAITYGISKFASGVLSDQCNARYFMAIGLMVSGILNIFFGLSSSLIMFALFWGLNGWFQGFGWPPCARFLTYWYSQSERGSWWSTWNLSHNAGSFLIPWLVGAIIQYFNWRFALYIPGIVCFAGGFFLINRLRDTPQSLGLPPIEKFRNDYAGAPRVATTDKPLSTREILFKYVFTNKFLWTLAAANFFVYIIRQGVNDWTALYLREEKGYSLLGASGCVSVFEIGGMLGSLVAGWASDYFFGARRGPVNVLFACAMVLAVLFFWTMPVNEPWMDSAAMFLLGFSVFGPQMMIGMFAAELAFKKAVSSSSGFVGTFAYMGAAVAGYPLGKITQEFGWEGYFMVLFACCVISVLILIPLWSVTENKQFTAANAASN